MRLSPFLPGELGGPFQVGQVLLRQGEHKCEWDVRLAQPFQSLLHRWKARADPRIRSWRSGAPSRLTAILSTNPRSASIFRCVITVPFVTSVVTILCWCASRQTHSNFEYSRGSSPDTLRTLYP